MRDFKKKLPKNCALFATLCVFCQLARYWIKMNFGTGDPEKFGDSSVTISVDYLFR